MEGVVEEAVEAVEAAEEEGVAEVVEEVVVAVDSRDRTTTATNPTRPRPTIRHWAKVPGAIVSGKHQDLIATSETNQVVRQDIGSQGFKRQRDQRPVPMSRLPHETLEAVALMNTRCNRNLTNSANNLSNSSPSISINTLHALLYHNLHTRLMARTHTHRHQGRVSNLVYHQDTNPLIMARVHPLMPMEHLINISKATDHHLSSDHLVHLVHLVQVHVQVLQFRVRAFQVRATQVIRILRHLILLQVMDMGLALTTTLAVDGIGSRIASLRNRPTYLGI